MYTGANIVPGAPAPANALPSEVKFVPHRIGTFRSEALCVADFTGSGKLDIVAGEYLYPAPDYKPVKIRTIKTNVDAKGKGYCNDFANMPLDVDGDGLLDLVSVDWFDKHAIWLKNPGKAGGEWATNLIEKNGNFETAQLGDVLGTGKAQQVLPAVAPTVWYEVVKGKFEKHVVCAKSMPFGVGCGDIKGDGKPAIIRPSAWFEQPADPREGKWIEHPLAIGNKQEGKADHVSTILVWDVNGDGMNDLITSSAHGAGIFWYEQIRKGTEITFKQHVIDNTWTQAHSLALGDIDGCGLPELVTGKRFMAHNGGDPEESGPLGVYYYKLNRKELKWTKHVISFNEGIGSGLNLCLADMKGSGRLDVVVTGKWGGPVWFENMGKAK